MADPLARLRAVLEAMDLSGGDADRRGLAALGTLWPELLAVVETGALVADHRRRSDTGGRLEPYEGDTVHRAHGAALRALLAAIDAALPEVTDAT